VRVDVRFVAATDVDLLAAVEAKTFRQDLYYRLAVVVLRTPSLRERRDDIRPLSEYFLERVSSKLGQTAPSILPDAMECLRGYSWPGNMRELQNSLERATVLGEWV
jgi:transcriptional regulator with PAS, ATPase and Fis domain